jgi:hypothetical protein
LLSALIAGVLSGVVVAVLTYLLTRRKTLAEIKFLEAQHEKIRRELSLNVDSISAAVTYKIAGSAERIIYDSTGRDVGFDFQGSEAQIWERIDGVDRAISGFGRGHLSLENGVLNIQRSNTEGRFEVWLQAYFFDGHQSQLMPGNDLISGQRGIRISFEAKALGASHTLRVVLKNEKSNNWLGNENRTITSNFWTPVKIYFQVPPADQCRLRIDDLDVTHAPSSVQIRNLVLAERLS